MVEVLSWTVSLNFREVLKTFGKQKQLAQLEREIPLVIKRSVGLYNGAGRGFNRIVGEKQHDADVEPLQSVMTLCEESYPAILYNAAVYYEVSV